MNSSEQPSICYLLFCLGDTQHVLTFWVKGQCSLRPSWREHSSCCPLSVSFSLFSVSRSSETGTNASWRTWEKTWSPPGPPTLVVAFSTALKKKRRREEISTIKLDYFCYHLSCSVRYCSRCWWELRTHLIGSESDPEVAGGGRGSVTSSDPSAWEGGTSVRERINTVSSEVEDSHTDLGCSSGSAAGITWISYRICEGARV